MQKITPENALFVMIDVQEKFRPVIHEIDRVLRYCDILCRASEMLDIPLTITEQYPAGLGKTMSHIHIPDHAEKYEKLRFSIFEPEIRNSLNTYGRDWLVLFGIETHVCVAQSALEALESGYRVMVVADAVSSRTAFNYEIALDRLRHAGCVVTSTEMLLFELLQDARHPKFGKISRLIK